MTIKRPFSSIAIIGYGDFWRLIEQIITHHSSDVLLGIISSKPGSNRITRDELSKYDVIVPCMPIAAGLEIFTKIEQFAPDSLIWEVCSIKKSPLQRIQDAGIKKYLCTHPMFGPYSYAKKGYSLHDLRIVMTEHTLDEKDFWSWMQWFQSLGLLTIVMSSEQHDEHLAETLFLTHYLGQIVAQAGFDRTTIDTVSFWFLMDAVESVKNDRQLFLDVWRYNPYCKAMIEKFHRAQETIEKLLE